jgi:DNA/RNA non-specific endonuclease
MNNATATLKSTTAITPPLKQDTRPKQSGMTDLVQLAARLSRQPQADPQTLRAVEARLTPVQKGELARLRDATPADKSSSAPVTSSKSPLALTQDRLTPVQQGELAREIIASRTPAPTKSGDAPTSKPSVAFAGGAVLEQRRALGIGDFFKDIGNDIKGGFNDAVDFVDDKIVDPVGDFFGNIDDFFKGPAGAAAAEVAGNITDAFAPVKNSLSGLVNGSVGKDFLSFAGTGTEWGKHLYALSKSPDGQLGFATGFGKGVLGGLEALATDVGKFAQLAGDTSPAGFLGDLIRDWDATGKLPSWLDEAVPSAERGQQAINDTINAAKSVAEYAKTRAEDPRLLREDITNYMNDNWNKLKGQYEAAKKQGPAAEGEFFGKIAGRAAFEIALEFVPGKAVLTVLKATEKLTDFVGTINKLPNGQKLPAAKLPEFNTHLDDLKVAADRAATSGYATDAELDSLEDAWEELNSLPPEKLGSGPAAIAANKKAIEVQNDVAEAINKVRLATPNPNTTPGVPQPNVRLSTGANDLKTKFNTQAAQNPPNTPTRITIPGNTNIPALHKNIANLTDESRVEYAIFRKPNGTGSDDIILYRGDQNNVDFDPADIQQLRNQGYELYAHTHVSGGYGNAIYSDPNLVASVEDQTLLTKLGQTSDSLIISSDGRTAKFDKNNKSIVGSNSHIDHKSFNNETDFNKAANAPAADRAYKSYEFNGYKFQTDSKGRVISASGELNTNPPNTPRQNAKLQTQIGHEGRPKRANNEYPDVGFHLIGHQFGGGINRLNVVPGDKFLNGTRNAAPGSGYSKANDYGNLEKRWSNFKAANPNNRIQVDIRPIYDDLMNEGITDRPSAFEIYWREFDATTNTWTNNHDYRVNDVPEDVIL